MKTKQPAAKPEIKGVKGAPPKKGAKQPIRKGGRKPVLEHDTVALAIVKCSGNLSAVARRFGVYRSSVQKLICKHEGLAELLADAREARLDDAEDALTLAIKAGEGWAVCFILKTLGKSRGYVERQELTGADGRAIPVTFIEINRDPTDRGSDAP